MGSPLPFPPPSTSLRTETNWPSEGGTEDVPALHAVPAAHVPASVLWQALLGFLPGQVVVGRTQPGGRLLDFNALLCVASGKILNFSVPHFPDL